MEMNDIISTLTKCRKIGISFHTSPDGDALGSSLALMLGLKQIGKEAYILSKDLVPDIYSFLPAAKEITGKNDQVLPNTDCIAILDCGNVDRISATLDLGKREYHLLNVDHHLSNDMYGDLNYVDTQAAAVGEVIYQILQHLGVTIGKEIATCLYTSLITDSGSFRHSSTTLMTHSIAGELIQTGIDFSSIHRIVFETKNFSRVKLYGKAIDTLYLEKGNKVSIMTITKQMLKELNMEMADTSDIVSIGLEIDSVEVAVLIKETEKGIKISLRSKNDVDVRKIAEQFGGGGHKKAAGLSLDKPLEEAKKMIMNAIEKELI